MEEENNKSIGKYQGWLSDIASRALSDLSTDKSVILFDENYEKRFFEGDFIGIYQDLSTKSDLSDAELFWCGAAGTVSAMLLQLTDKLFPQHRKKEWPNATSVLAEVEKRFSPERIVKSSLARQMAVTRLQALFLQREFSKITEGKSTFFGHIFSSNKLSDRFVLDLLETPQSNWASWVIPLFEAAVTYRDFPAELERHLENGEKVEAEDSSRIKGFDTPYPDFMFYIIVRAFSCLMESLDQISDGSIKLLPNHPQLQVVFAEGKMGFYSDIYKYYNQSWRDFMAQPSEERRGGRAAIYKIYPLEQRLHPETLAWLDSFLGEKKDAKFSATAIDWPKDYLLLGKKGGAPLGFESSDEVSARDVLVEWISNWPSSFAYGSSPLQAYSMRGTINSLIEHLEDEGGKMVYKHYLDKKYEIRDFGYTQGEPVGIIGYAGEIRISRYGQLREYSSLLFRYVTQE